MKRLIVVAALALCACTVPAPVAPPPSVTQAPAEPALSDGATKIVAAMRARPDIDTICAGGQAFHDAMREVVIRMMMTGELVGNPRSDAEAAADYLHAHCGQPAPASTAAPDKTAK